MTAVNANSLKFGIKNGAVLVIVEGEARAGDTFALNECLLPYLDGVDAARSIFVDLSKCAYMDSTFIGFVTALAIKSGRRGSGPVRIVSPSEKARAALRKLSAMKEFEMVDAGGAPDVPVFAVRTPRGAFDSRKNIELIFEAHLTLSGLSEENRGEFENLLHELARVLRAG